MTQLRNHWITAQDMVRSRSWREGYESYRLGQPPIYGVYRRKALAYEYGRLVAAFLHGRDGRLVRVQTTRPVNEHYIPIFVDALKQIVGEDAF